VSKKLLYMVSEYTAMDYIPLSLISIILAFVPALSIVIERIVYKRQPRRKTVIGVAACICRRRHRDSIRLRRYQRDGAITAIYLICANL
jgi:hypothetical protein